MIRAGHAAAGLALLLAGLPDRADARDLPLWEAGFGAAALSLPDYRGSNERHPYLLPLPYLVYRGDRLKVDREGLRARLFDNDRLDLNLSAAANFALRSRDNVARQGMPTLYPVVEVGPELIYKIIGEKRSSMQLDLRVATRAAFAVGGGRVAFEGWVTTPYLRLDLPNAGGSGFEASFSAGPLFGDRRYHDYIYGVAPQFATPSRGAYEAKAGYAGFQLLAGASRRFGDVWFGAFVRFDSLRGAAFEPSPLEQSSRYVAAGLAVSWILGTSTERVSDND